MSELRYMGEPVRVLVECADHPAASGGTCVAFAHRESRQGTSVAGSTFGLAPDDHGAYFAWPYGPRAADVIRSQKLPTVVLFREIERRRKPRGQTRREAALLRDAIGTLSGAGAALAAEEAHKLAWRAAPRETGQTPAIPIDEETPVFLVCPECPDGADPIRGTISAAESTP